MRKEIECKRCGACCYYEKEGKLIRCRYLQDAKDNKKICKIYYRNGRVGIQIDKKKYCNLRENTGELIENCPYNAIVSQKINERYLKT